MSEANMHHDEDPEAVAGAGELTDAERLTALEAYLKPLKAIAAELRVRVTADMGLRRVERVGAYLPDGTKVGAVGYVAGAVKAKVVDPEAALKWCAERYPDEILHIREINSAFLTRLLSVAKIGGRPGDVGVDPLTGEVLDFIEVAQGSPYVSVTTTDDGAERMTALAYEFAETLGAPTT